MSVSLESFFSQTMLPEAALAPVVSAVDTYTSMVAQSNKWIAEIHQAKAQDPNNLEYVDSLWKAEAEAGNPLVAEIAAEFYAVAETYEKLNKSLREIAKKNFVRPPLSEDEQKEARKKVNESAETIKAARAAAIAMLAIPEAMLKNLGVEIPDGGLATLLPAAESLKSGRGRKAATSSGEVSSYTTRVGEIIVNGTSTNVDGKGKFVYGSEAISKLWNADQEPANKVTSKELEAAFFEAIGKEFRAITGKDIPESTEFVFTKIVKVQNANDDSTTDVPKKVKVIVKRADTSKDTENKSETDTENKTENKSADSDIESAAPVNKSATPAESKPESKSTKSPAAPAAPAKK